MLRQNPADQRSIPSIYVPTVVYPSLVPKPVDESFRPLVPSGDRFDHVPLSEPDLSKQPTRSALKGTKKKELSKELEVKLQERLSLTENGSPRNSAVTDGSGGRASGGGGVKFGATEEHLTTPTGALAAAGQGLSMNAYVHGSHWDSRLLTPQVAVCALLF